MMNCRQATRLMSDMLERKLGLKEKAALKFHVMMCSACHNFGKQMNVLREISKAYVKGEPETCEENRSDSQEEDKKSRE